MTSVKSFGILVEARGEGVQSPESPVIADIAVIGKGKPLPLRHRDTEGIG